MNSEHEYKPDARPPFAFCEPWYAASLRPWCIRRVGPEGLKLGGGITSEPLCRRWACNGWDLLVRIRPEYFVEKPDGRRVVCPHCAAEYQALAASARLDPDAVCPTPE